MLQSKLIEHLMINDDAFVALLTGVGIAICIIDIYMGMVIFYFVEINLKF